MKQVQLSNGGFATVDDEDFHRTEGRSWWRTPGGYAATERNKREGRVLLHWLVMGRPKIGELDHINGNGLDNRKANLRIVTRQQNAMNKGPNKNNTTGFKGVCFDKSRGKYIVGVKVNYRRINLGRYETAEEAARVYDKAARKYHGEFARLNFP
jgi:hypothetical protein